MKFKFITTSDPLYKKECELRNEVLRKPLGFPPGAEIFPFEDESYHLLAIDGDEVVGCALFRPEGKTGRMFQMAVEQDHRGKGIGKELVRMLENYLAERGFEEIYIHARALSADFYKKLGYVTEGDEFIEIGIVHLKMKKAISE